MKLLCQNNPCFSPSKAISQAILCFPQKRQVNAEMAPSNTTRWNSIRSIPTLCLWLSTHFIQLYTFKYQYFFFLWRCDPTRVMASSYLRFLDHTQRSTTVGRTPLNKWSARRRDLYLTTHNTHNRQTSMPPVEFKPTISADERPQTYALDRAATGTGNTSIIVPCK